MKSDTLRDVALSLLPRQLNLPASIRTILQVMPNECLVCDTSISRHRLKVVYRVVVEHYRDRFREPVRVRIISRIQLLNIVFFPHVRLAFLCSGVWLQ